MKILRPEEALKLSPEEFGKLFDRPELTPEELKEAYALARAAFTAEDLQKYTELDQGIPVDELLAELEEMQKQIDQRRQ